MNKQRCIKLKLFTPFQNFDRYADEWNNRMIPDTKVYIVGDSISLRWVFNSEEADYHVVMNDTSSPQLIKEKSIWLRMEPKIHMEDRNIFINPNPEKYRYLASKHNAIEWHLERNINQLLNDLKDGNQIKKTKILSTITSGLNTDKGHRLRLEFIQRLEELKNFDFYGRHHSSHKAYRGSLPSLKKDAALLKYKYTFAAENSWEHGYFTEKIVDAILCECLPFYWGCPDLEQYLDPQSFIRIDLEKPDEAMNTIKNAIANDEYSKRLPAIRAMKHKIITQLSIMPMLGRIIQEIEDQDAKYNKLFMEDSSPLRIFNPSNNKVYRDVPGLRQEVDQISEMVKYISVVRKYQFYILRFDADISQILPDYLSKFKVPTASSPIGANINVKSISADGIEDLKSKPKDVLSPTADYAKGITIITAYYYINKSKLTYKNYQDNIQRFVNLKCDLIIFTDLKSYQWLKSLRHPANTRIYVKDMDEFEVNKYNDYWKYCMSIDRETYHSEDLYKIWHERFISLTHEAIRINPFKSRYFFWVDIGSFREPKEPIPNFPSFNKIRNVMSNDKFILASPLYFDQNQIEMKDLPDGEKGSESRKGTESRKIFSKLLNTHDGKSCDPTNTTVQGGFMGGSIEGWKLFKDLYLKQLKLFIDHKIFGGKDQQLLTNMYLTNPDKFTLLVGQHFLKGKYVDSWYYSLYNLAED
jgi:hypothetical protein